MHPVSSTSAELTQLQQLRTQLKKSRHRALLVLSGSLEWQITQLSSLWQTSETLLWAGQVPDKFADYATAIKPAQYPHLLGQEVDSVVIDSRAGFSANGLGILSGLIRAGGLLVFLTEHKSKWVGLPNPDNQRFLSSPFSTKSALPYFNQHLAACFIKSAIWLSEQDSKDQTVEAIRNIVSRQANPSPPHALPTKDQQVALQKIDRVAFGHRKRPLVLSADRGRGKTSVLGISAVQLLIKGKQHIVLTASRYDQVSTAFKQACQLLQNECPGCVMHLEKAGLLKFEYQQQTKTIEFIAPDQLVLRPSLADVLMVDEAAHLPTPLLTGLLKTHHRIIFATTLHGYEGSGRGFELRFKKTLNTFTPNWQSVHLQSPVRWAEYDPLESAINHALLLDSQLDTELDFNHFNLERLTTNNVATQHLACNPKQLQSVFNLLVHAHYQTTPNDLQQLLSAPNLQLFIAEVDQKIVGVALCVVEGAVTNSTERLHGHLVPQLLVNNYTQTDFLALSTWRVMRVAVHPSVQKMGIGKQLLTTIKAFTRQAKVDYLSSSFGATDELLPFWFEQGFTPIHIGVKRDKASGSHNLVVAQAVSELAQKKLAKIQSAFQAQFPHTLIESLSHLSAKMILAIIRTFEFNDSAQQHQLNQAMLAYQNGQRAYESVSGLLWLWSLQNGDIISQADALHQSVWCDKVLKKLPWETVATSYQLAGRRGVESILKAIKNPSETGSQSLGS